MAAIEEKGLLVMKDWPPNSPDLNLIENVWGVIKQNLQKRRPRPYKEADMKKAALEEWQAVDQAQIMAFCESMPRRIMNVIIAEGGLTHY